MQTLLITGTNAQVGKTVVLAALIAYWQRYRAQQVGVMKPIDYVRASDPLNSGPLNSGPPNFNPLEPNKFDQRPTTEPDCERLKRLFNLAQTPGQITPVMLAAPTVVAESGSSIPLEQLWRSLQQLQQQYDLVLLEALGGLGTPLTAETTMADLAWDWRIPTVLVVPVQSGMVADAVANVALANQSRLHLKGIILNHSRPGGGNDWADLEASIQLIQSLTRKPVLGCIPHLNPNNLSQLAQAAADLDLDRLLPGLAAVL